MKRIIINHHQDHSWAIRYVHCSSMILDLSLQNSLWTYEVVKDVLGHVGVHGRQRVIQQVHVSVAV